MKFFTYGIFLSYRMRKNYNIDASAHYATVEGYSTRGGLIVEAFPCAGHTLTGLVVDVPDHVWRTLDAIESGYDRITINTTQGEEAQLYVAKTDRRTHAS